MVEAGYISCDVDNIFSTLLLLTFNPRGIVASKRVFCAAVVGVEYERC